MSSRSNVLKLLGCCLELPSPALVYEYAESGVLDAQIQNGSLPWGTRLKIAKEIANAVTYLHCKFPSPIIHRAIKPANIFLNQRYDAKLVDFSWAISIPEGKSHVEVNKIVGTYGFMDIDYATKGFVTEKTDVYSFGMLLLVLLTGRGTVVKLAKSRRESPKILMLTQYVIDLVEKDHVNEVVDPRIWSNGK